MWRAGQRQNGWRDYGGISWLLPKGYRWPHIDIAPRMTAVDGVFWKKGAASAPVSAVVENRREMCEVGDWKVEDGMWKMGVGCSENKEWKKNRTALWVSSFVGVVLKGLVVIAVWLAQQLS